jgi:hypothetical protein
MKLESLRKFKIEKSICGNVFGGNGGAKWIQTTQDPFKDKNGCTVTTTDSYYDKNGNGKHDDGESATACISVNCE